MLDDAREETVSQTGDGEPGTKDAEALAAALNHSAERVQTLWFSFLTFMLYLAVATGTTTHRMLFLEEPLNLPVLNIDLPLLGFYILTPIIFVIFHFYMLLNLVLLARTAKSFENALERAFPEDGEPRETFRMRIENTVFVQLLVGGRLEREGINATLLSAMALITLALFPVLLLLLLEIKFLPYHSEWITWLHRSLLALDLAMVCTLWPAYRSGWGVRLWPKSSWRLVPASILSAVAMAYAVAGATFPDERIYLKTNWLHGKTVWKTLNTLDLDGEDLIDDAKLAHLIEKNESPSGTQRWVSSLSLNGRDLMESRLAGADLRHVDFSNTILNRADFLNAWVTNAHFDGATLRGTFFQGAHLQGAKLDQAELQGTAFYRADLKGASLYQAQLQGAFLAQANLQGAEFGGAELQGASLNGAQLQGATLEGALLQGANLDGVHLQGANLDHAELQGAWLVNAFVWRADARKANWKGAFIAGPHPQPATLCDPGNACNWTAHTLKKIEQRIADEVPEGNNRSDAIKKIKPRLDPDKVMEGEKEMAKFWAAREHEAIDLQVYEKSVAEQWRNIGCAAEGAPYVLRQLLDRLHEDRPFEEDSLEKPKLAAAFLAKDCIGAHGLSQDEIAKLKKVAAPAATQPPKP